MPDQQPTQDDQAATQPAADPTTQAAPTAEQPTAPDQPAAATQSLTAFAATIADQIAAAILAFLTQQPALDQPAADPTTSDQSTGDAPALVAKPTSTQDAALDNAPAPGLIMPRPPFAGPFGDVGLPQMNLKVNFTSFKVEGFGISLTVGDQQA